MIDNFSNLFQYINLARSEADQINSVNVQLMAAEHGSEIAGEMSSDPMIQNSSAIVNPLDDRQLRFAMIKYYVEKMRLELDAIESEVDASS